MAAFAPCLRPSPIPAATGIGLKAAHLADVAAGHARVAWFEVHAENYLGAGGPPHAYLGAIRRDHPLSLHGVGLSLGSAEAPDPEHLAAIRALADRYQPGLVSEHLSWSVTGGVYLNDLLPLPLTEESLALVAGHVRRVQDVLGRRILIENPSTYLRFRHSTIVEPEFLAALAAATGCGLLLDINNVVVSETNHGGDARAYIDAVPPAAVSQFHLAGHHVTDQGGRALLIDDHGAAPQAAVLDLFAYALERIGPRPTLLEWDSNVPALAIMEAEAARAERLLCAARQAGEVRHVRAG